MGGRSASRILTSAAPPCSGGREPVSSRSMSPPAAESVQPPASADFVAGRAVALSRRIERVLADNPGRMTGPGTNSYLIHGPGTGTPCVVLDPGPDSAAHVDALIAATAGRRVEAILVTHTHRDHSPAAGELARRLGAPRYGRIARYPAFQDPSFRAERSVEDAMVLAGEGYTLRAIATPGHASNHVCWYLEEEATLFTGDHVLGTVSPVILPPDGDMGEYLDSLARLVALAPNRLMPGHGPALEDPPAVMKALIAHRLAREAKLLAALPAEPLPLDALVRRVYDDVDPALHAWAQYSLEAHLIKLERESRAVRVPGAPERWRAAT
jgi:glyoxylase-like metal-dependent hydrolase (beta-lactamase superfamily II)